MEKKEHLKKYWREYHSNRRKTRRDQGLCPSCGERPPVKDGKNCEQCREKTREHNVNARDRRKSQGLCLKCNSPVFKGKSHCEYHMQKSRQRWRDYRNIVLNHYGGICSCCEENIQEFLCIDHIHGGGNGHRKQLANNGMKKTHGSGFYKWLIDEGFPKGYQVLCHNCNMAKGFYGKCPHESLKME